MDAADVVAVYEAGDEDARLALERNRSSGNAPANS